MKIVTAAKTWVGTKYHHQGRLKKTDIHLGGVDCFGLVMGVANELEIAGMNNLPLAKFDRFDYGMTPDGKRLVEFLDKHFLSVSKIRSGDILLFSFFGNPQHIGIVSNVIADDKIEIIHCYSGSGMVVQHYLSPVWIHMISGVYRFRFTLSSNDADTARSMVKRKKMDCLGTSRAMTMHRCREIK